MIERQLMLVLVALLAALILFTLIRLTWRSFRKEDEEKNPLEMRKKQSVSSLRENALKRRLEALVEERAKKSKRLKIEEMCMQAGLHWTYGEYKLVGYFAGIVMFIAVYAGLHNWFTAAVFAFIGTLIPGQIIHVIRNARVARLEKQVGSFMRLVTERYNSTKNFAQAILESTKDFKGQEPMYSELKRASADLAIGVDATETIRKLAKRTGSKYLMRMADYYQIASELGTVETRQNLLKQSLLQYEKNRSIKSRLRNELNGPVREAYIMTAMVPIVGVYMAMSTQQYRTFFLQTTMGQTALGLIVLVLVGCVWFINHQIGKPLD
jgi:tight adherence protein B